MTEFIYQTFTDPDTRAIAWLVVVCLVILAWTAIQRWRALGSDLEVAMRVAREAARARHLEMALRAAAGAESDSAVSGRVESASEPQAVGVRLAVGAPVRARGRR